MRASLADQPSAAAQLAIALGANLPSPVGPPQATLQAVRPQLERVLEELLPEPIALRQGGLRWSPLFSTAPMGGPGGQPHYLNAVVLVGPTHQPTIRAARELLGQLQHLEQRFARVRSERWGPRSLDLDLLWWGELCWSSEALELPHPRLLERAFVLAPLAAIDAQLVPPGAETTAADLLAAVQAQDTEPAPERLAGQPGWPE